jgi:hypothetical protein
VRSAWVASAYAPLFVLVAVREFFDGEWWLAMALIAAAVLGVAISVFALHPRLTDAPSYRPVKNVVDSSADVATYLVTFVLPLAVITGKAITDVITLCGFMVLLTALFVRSHRLVLNPTLVIIGYAWKTVLFTDTGESAAVLLPPRVPMEGHLASSVGVGTSAAADPQLLVCHLAPGQWLARKPTEGGGK